MSFGGGKQEGQKPVFFEGQKDVAARGVSALEARMFGGGPDFGTENAAARRAEDVTRSAASAGFAASDPVTQARLATVDAAKVSSEEQMFMAMLERIFTPAGQSGGGGWNFTAGLFG